MFFLIHLVKLHIIEPCKGSEMLIPIIPTEKKVKMETIDKDGTTETMLTIGKKSTTVVLRDSKNFACHLEITITYRFNNNRFIPYTMTTAQKSLWGFLPIPILFRDK